MTSEKKDTFRPVLMAGQKMTIQTDGTVPSLNEVLGKNHWTISKMKHSLAQRVHNAIRSYSYSIESDPSTKTILWSNGLLTQSGDGDGQTGWE